MLGLGTNVAQFDPVPVLGGSFDRSAGWLAYAGVGDDTLQEIYTGGGIRGHDIAAVSDSEGVLFYNDGITTHEVNVIDSNGTENTPLVLSKAPGVAGLGSLVRLTTTRFLGHSVTNNGANVHTLFLLGKSGKTMSELDVDEGNLIAYDVAGWNMIRLSDTKAVLVINSNVNKTANIWVIDLASDTITIGTPITKVSTLGGSYPGVAALSETEFVVAHSETIAGYSVSGTTITLEDEIDVVAAGTNFNDMALEYVGNNNFILTYEGTVGGADDVFANTFSFDGSTMTRYNEEVMISSENTFQAWGASTALGNGEMMYAHNHGASTSTDGSHVTVMGCAPDGTLYIGSTLRRSGDFQADHTTIDMSPSGDYVWMAYQDEATVPIQQVGFRRLKKPVNGLSNTKPTLITDVWANAKSQFIPGSDYCYDGTNPVIFDAIGNTNGFILGDRNGDTAPTITAGEVVFDGASFMSHKNYGFDDFVRQMPVSLAGGGVDLGFYFLINTPATVTRARLLICSDSTNGREGVELEIFSATELRVGIRAAGVHLSNPTVTSLPTNSTVLIVVSVDKETIANSGGGTFWVNSDASDYDVWNNDTHTTNTTRDAVPVIGSSNGAGANFMPTGYDVIEWGWGEGQINETLKNSIKSHINTQYSLSL